MKEKKLLQESLENYRLLKQQYLLLQQENEKIKSNFNNEIKEIENDKNKLYNDIDEFQSYINSLLSEIEKEKEKRENLFSEFQSSTLNEIQTLYQKELEQLTVELSNYDEQLMEKEKENGKLIETIESLRKELNNFENLQKQSELKLKQKYENEIQNLSKQLKKYSTDNELIQKLEKELELERLEINSLKDEKNHLIKQQQSIIAEKNDEIKKLNDEIFKLNKFKTDFNIEIQRLKVENNSLQKNISSSVEREKDLKNKLTDIENDKIEIISKMKKNDLTKESEYTTLISKLESQNKTLTLKIDENLNYIDNLKKEINEIKKIKFENEKIFKNYENSIKNHQNDIQKLELFIQTEKQNYEKKINQILFEKDCIEHKVDDVISKSKADKYLIEIDKLNQIIDDKNDEMVRLKAHYRSLLSKMKRALEKNESVINT